MTPDRLGCHFKRVPGADRRLVRKGTRD